jgi:FKBP-type peptidyl-prolyl cis-trans isomerase FkpA
LTTEAVAEVINNNNNSKMIKMNNLIKGFLFTGLIMILLSSCDLTKKYEKEEKEEIQNFLSQHPELTFELKASGLYFMDVTDGTGEKPVLNDSAFVTYTGYFLDGTKFDTNVGSDLFGFPVGVGFVIPGFDEGVMLMREGGTAKMLMPSYIGYGNSGYYMAAYTPLLFDVKLDSIVPGSGK